MIEKDIDCEGICLAGVLAYGSRWRTYKLAGLTGSRMKR